MPKFSRLVLVSLFAVGVSFAAAGHTASITISSEVHAGATSIPAGDYKLTWTADTGDAELAVTHNKQQYSIPVTIQPGTSAGGDQVLTRTDGDSQVLQGFKVKNVLLMVR